MGVFTKDPAPAPPPAPYATPTDAPRTLTAAAQRMRVDDRKAMDNLRTQTADTQWQHRAWLAYESVGEIHFAFNLVANLISRIRFFPAADTTPNSPPSYVHDARDLTPGLDAAADAAVRRLASSQGEMGSLARALALNLSIPGECYLVQLPATTILSTEGTTSYPERWEVRSTDEVVVTQDARAPDPHPELLHHTAAGPDQPPAARVHRPHLAPSPALVEPG